LGPGSWNVLGVRLARAVLLSEGGQLLAHAFVAGVLGEDAFEVLPRLRLLSLHEVVLGALGQGETADLRRPRARAESLLQRLVHGLVEPLLAEGLPGSR
jgi:hypothetical protein